MKTYLFCWKPSVIRWSVPPSSASSCSLPVSLHLPPSLNVSLCPSRFSVPFIHSLPLPVLLFPHLLLLCCLITLHTHTSPPPLLLISITVITLCLSTLLFTHFDSPFFICMSSPLYPSFTYPLCPLTTSPTVRHLLNSTRGQSKERQSSC